MRVGACGVWRLRGGDEEVGSFAWVAGSEVLGGFTMVHESGKGRSVVICFVRWYQALGQYIDGFEGRITSSWAIEKRHTLVL